MKKRSINHELHVRTEGPFHSGERRAPSRAALGFCLAAAGLILAVPGQAAVTLTVAGGVNNPPAPVNSGGALNPEQTAVAYTASVVSEATINNVLQWTLNAQGYSAANNWILNNNTVTLNGNDQYNLTAYSLAYNGGVNNGFSQTVNFGLQNPVNGNANLYAGVPANATVHWMQLLVESYRVNNFGFPVAGPPPILKLDNGSTTGVAAAAPGAPVGGAGPYYDSNGPLGFSTPPTFSDTPGNYLGNGFYFRAFTFPTWDVFTPAGGGNPARDTMYIGDVGVSWGFSITAANNPGANGNVPIPVVPAPETSTTVAGGLTVLLALGLVARKRQNAAHPAA